MRFIIFYIISALWGMATMASSFVVATRIAESYVESVRSSGAVGHPSPLLFFLPFLLVFGLSTLAFLAGNALCVKFLLSEAGVRHFLLALLIYSVAAVGGWGMAVVLDF